MLLESVYDGAPSIVTGKYLTTVNEFTDQVPALRSAVLIEACERVMQLGPLSGVTKLLVEEDKGAILGSALCIATGLPLAVARWYPYNLATVGGNAEVFAVPLESEYFTGTLFVNGLSAGDRVLIVDDTISTGGTLAALINAANDSGAQVIDIRVVVEKMDNGGVARISDKFGIPVRSVIGISIDPETRQARVVKGTDNDGVTTA